MLRDFRKPLVIAAPKIGLKHPKAVSELKAFQAGNQFKPIIADRFGSGVIRKVIFCSGKVNFDIAARFEKNAPGQGVLVIRMEELAPFPVKKVKEMIQ